MSERAEPGKKFVLGWLTARPGKRDEFMAISQDYIKTCREEPGVILFEFHPSLTDPDLVLVIECFETAEAHDRHLAMPHFAAMWKEVERLIVGARFENVYASEVVSETMTFENSLTLPQASTARI
jgi:quinol monooxygenase YgiN